MVKPPDIAELVRETEEGEELAKLRKEGKVSRLERKIELLGELSQARVQDIAPIPDMFEKGQFSVSATKEYFPVNALVKDKMDLQFPMML